MKDFTKNGFVVTAVHVGVVGLVLVGSEVMSHFMKENDVIPVEFTVAIPDFGQVQDKQKPAPPVPQKDPTPDADDDTPQPVDTKPAVTAVVTKPDPAKPDKPKIKKASDIKIGKIVKGNRKPNLPPPTTKEKTLSLDEIRKLLDAGATAGTRTSIPEGDPRFYAIIRNVLYNAWQQPSSLVAGGRSVVAELRFLSNGQVAGYRIVTSSGSPEMDQTVNDALASVVSVPNVPASFFEDHDRIPITFQLTGE